MSKEIKVCYNCGFELTKIAWTKDKSNDLTLNEEKQDLLIRNSLVRHPDKTVYCAECYAELGTNKDLS